MAQLTLHDARVVEASFEGRITSSHEAHTEFVDRPTVLVPESVEDVARALQLARAADRRVFVRSGHAVATADRGPTAGPAGVSPTPGVVVSMEVFRTVDVDGQRVTVGVAATTGDVARELVDTGVFLPLRDDPTQSIVSAVLTADVTPFPRSASRQDPLRGAVTEARVVPTEGPDAGVATTMGPSELADLWAGRSTGIVTSLVLDGAAWAADESVRWLRAWMVPYDAATFAGLCDALFDAEVAPQHVDLSLRVTSAAFAMKLVVVRATGRGDVDRDKASQSIQAVLAAAGCAVLSSDEVRGPGSSIAAWVSTGPGSARAEEVHARFGPTGPRRFSTFRKDFLEAVDFAIGVGDGKERAPGVEAWAELELLPGGEVDARAHLAVGKAQPPVSAQARALLERAIPTPPPSATAAAHDALRGIEVLPELAAVPAFVLTASNRRGADEIPGFQGDVLAKADNRRDYRKAVGQYAVSSYDDAVVQARMSPRFVAEPTDARDVETAVRFAADEGLKVVARSGGHQYCGMSSGGDGTLVLDMKRFSKVEFSADKTRVTVGPGVRLQKLSDLLRDEGVTIPHGECPLVNLGGHVQTGGVGHQLRGLGVALDWVRSFDMVAGGPDGVYRERTYTRPATPAAADPTDDDVFRAVLGGGPGSWGVLTAITFELVPDGEHPDSHGFSATYPYQKEAFRAAMEQLRACAELEAGGDLPPGVDLFLTVVSGESFSLTRPHTLFRPAALLVETTSLDAAGVPLIRGAVRAVEQELTAAGGLVGALAGLVVHSVAGKEDLSVIADAGVRSIGAFGLPASGREFDLPYKKSLYITRTPFSAAFRDRFVDLVDHVNGRDGLKVVFQAAVGGGDFVTNGAARTTHMQRRDALVQLVFDVFYEEGHRDDAEECQAAMRALLQEFSGGADLRMFWGTFEEPDTDGAQLDMSRAATRDLYYDDDATYQLLQRIKAYVDSDGVFHTAFTVQLPA